MVHKLTLVCRVKDVQVSVNSVSAQPALCLLNVTCISCCAVSFLRKSRLAGHSVELCSFGVRNREPSNYRLNMPRLHKLNIKLQHLSVYQRPDKDY